jgi:hypothetical protein
MDSTVPWVQQSLEPAPFGMSIGSLVEEYLADCRRRGLSPKTFDCAYGYPLGMSSCPGVLASALAILGGLSFCCPACWRRWTAGSSSAKSATSRSSSAPTTARTGGGCDAGSSGLSDDQDW